MSSVLDIQNLQVSYWSREIRSRPVLSGVSFDLMPGEILGVLGESGSGKSTLAASVLRLLPPNGQISGGAVLFEGKNLLQAGYQELRQIRGGRISLIFQEPSLALHPTIRVGDQVRQVLGAHQSSAKKELAERTRQIFSRLFPEDADRIARSYPHQLSGGQRQRIVIAQAVACRPALLIADEPTSKLDGLLSSEILALLSELRKRYSTAIVVISHDPALCAAFADRIVLMYAGRIVEAGNSEAVFARPLHPYTQALVGLMRSSTLAGASAKIPFPRIDGESPDPTTISIGCSFEPRCPQRLEVCALRSPEDAVPEPSRCVSCFKYDESFPNA